MRSVPLIFAIVAVSFAAPAAAANERGAVIRAGDLYAQPFIDSVKIGPLTADQPVTIAERRGGWMAVDAGGRQGWVRILNVRLEAGTAGSAAARSTAAFQTGSTARTVATGVKGLDEADIRNASPDRNQLALLDTLAASEAAARQKAVEAGLKETTVGYLKKTGR